MGRATMTDGPPDNAEPAGGHPPIVGDVVFGSMDSPVAVCTLATRTLLPELAGRPEIAVAGRVFTENVGLERMVQNLLAFETVRYLIVCGHETRHRVGQTIFALYRHGLDEAGRVVGSEAPDPVMPNLTAEQLQAFRARITLVDMVGVLDTEAILSRARELAAADAQATPASAPSEATPVPAPPESPVERIAATRNPADAWVHDPAGYFLIFVDRARRLIRAEQYSQGHRLLRVVEGRSAEDLSHTITRLGLVSLLPHATYLGRELAKAEAALALDLAYEQDRPLIGDARPPT